MQPAQDFRMIPEKDQLATMERELRFFPCENDHPQTLTKAQVEQFNGDGFLSGIPIFSPAEIAGHRAFFDDLLERILAAGGDAYSISTAHLKYPEVYDLLTDHRIVACVRDLLGPNIIGWGSHYFCKLPGDAKQVSWHQDASYWPLTPSKTITVWLAIDDADRENACMQFLPGTHLAGHLQYQDSDAAEGNVLDQTVDIRNSAPPIDVILPAGSISLHSDLLLHGSQANYSSRRRCGLTLRYCSADVKAGLDWHKKGVVVAGEDPSGHWANPPRPA